MEMCKDFIFFDMVRTIDLSINGGVLFHDGPRLCLKGFQRHGPILMINYIVTI